MPHFRVVSRNYADIFKMMTSLGPRVSTAGIAAKGIAWKADEEIEELKGRLGVVLDKGVSEGLADLSTGKNVAEAILAVAQFPPRVAIPEMVVVPTYL